MTHSNISKIDAYRYFFIAGYVLGLWGVLIWALFHWNLVPYPGIKHPDIMIGGFFLCFACGFLMTAAPKFTASFGPTKSEQNLTWTLIFFLFLSLLPSDAVYFHFVVLALFAFLIFFMVRRFLNRQSKVPDAFLFVGFGLGSGITGSAILLISHFVDVGVKLHALGRLLFLHTYILCLVLGVGSRLIPALLGRGPMPTDMQKMKSQKKTFVLAGILFIGSYMLEAWNATWISQGLRSCLVAFIAFTFWKIHKLPARKSYQSYALWLSAWCLLLGQWALTFLPAYRIHLLHVILVSGLALMTFMIASRVILAHGHHNMDLEIRSKGLFLGALLIGTAGFTRLSAGFAPQIYQSHLFYAACTWILGLLIWGFCFLPKIIKLNHSIATYEK